MPPDAAARAEIERAPVGRLAAPLLAIEHLRRLCHEWRIGYCILPRMEADGVSEPVVHEAPTRCRFDITTLIVFSRTSVGLNSTISVPA